MKPVLLALAVATVGSITYHVGQKLVPQDAHPMGMLVAAWLVAIAAGLLALPLLPTQGSSLSGLATGPAIRAALVLGLGILLIEGGFLLAYRWGASLQGSGIAVNGLAAVVLVPVALLLFKEAFSGPKAAGIALVLAGLALIARK